MSESLEEPSDGGGEVDRLKDIFYKKYFCNRGLSGLPFFKVNE